MELLIILASLLTTSLAFPKTVINLRNLSKPNPLDTDFYKNGKIIGGTPALPHQFPFQAFLEMHSPGGTRGCSGSLIEPNVILTAGSCAFQATRAIVILGAQNPLVNEPDQKRIVSNDIRVHKNFDIYNRVHDIALIILPEDVIVPGKIASIKVALLNHNYDPDNPEITVRMSGWGLTDSGATTLSTNLMYIDSKMISTDICGIVYEGITDYRICTVLGAACTGDTGGPLVINLDSNYLYIIGIISYGNQNCLTKYPTVSTNVYYYHEWIEANKK